MPSRINFPVVPVATPSRKLRALGAPVLGSLLLAGCFSGQKPVVLAPQAPAPAAPVAPVVPAAPAIPDPIAELIAASDAHFEAGRNELAQGHLEQAKTEFDRALDTLLESPAGARSNPRLREHFDRLVE